MSYYNKNKKTLLKKLMKNIIMGMVKKKLLNFIRKTKKRSQKKKEIYIIQ